MFVMFTMIFNEMLLGFYWETKVLDDNGEVRASTSGPDDANYIKNASGEHSSAFRSRIS